MSPTKSIFEFDGCREYLRHLIASHRTERGYQARLAGRAGCHPSFLSQVLGGRAHLSQEHVLAIAHYLALSYAETEYFLTLLDGERAGSTPLRQHYTRKRKELRRRPSEGAIPEQRLRTEAEEAFYYGR